MFNQFEPNIKATITFLRLLSVKANAASVNETLQNHPDWPSLLCISDSLNKWNIPNAAGKIEPKQLDDWYLAEKRIMNVLPINIQ